MDSAFSVFEILKTSWDITRKNFLIIIGYSVLAFISLVALQFALVFLMSVKNNLLNFAGMFIVLIINSVATLGFYKLIFHLIDNETDDFNFNDVIPSWKNIWSFITLTLLLGLVVTTGSIIYKQALNVDSFNNLILQAKNNAIFLQILGFLVFVIFLLIMMRYMFFACFIVDDNSASFESLRQSRQLTKDNLLKIITVLMMVIGFIVLGFLAFGIGIVITYPFTNVILVVTYRKLVYNYEEEHPEAPFEKH